MYKWFYIFLLLIFFSPILNAGDKSTFFFPDTTDPLSITILPKLALATIPEDMIEENSYFLRGPLIGVESTLDLPGDFMLIAGLNSNYLTWHLALGPKWNFSILFLNCNIGYDIAYWFGSLNQDGFRSSIYGWINYPNISVGYDFGKVSLTLKGEIIILTQLTEKVDDLIVSDNKNQLAGASLGIYIEQPLWKNNSMLIGMKAHFAEYYYPVWAAYPTFRRTFFIPEFTVGLIL